MITALVGFMPKVIGSSRASAAEGPKPGMMPTIMPPNTPTSR
jgi:hypothetical protein